MWVNHYHINGGPRFHFHRDFQGVLRVFKREREGGVIENNRGDAVIFYFILSHLCSEYFWLPLKFPNKS